MAAAPSFRLAGIPVRVEPVFFVIVALLGLGQEPRFVLSWVVIAFGAILLHELGHAVAFRAFGIQPSIVLTGFGGVTSGRGDLTPGRSIVVSLAGPLSGLVLVGLPALWAEAAGLVEGDDARVLLSQVVWITIGWSLLNLLPVLPLDGGAVTASVLDLVRPGRGRRMTAWVSVVVAAAAAAAALAYGLLFGVLLAAWFLAANVSELGAARRRAVKVDLQVAERALLGGQPQMAEERAQAALRGRASPADAARARELTAWARLARGDLRGAGEAAGAVDRRGRPSPGGAPGGGPAADLLPATGPGAVPAGGAGPGRGAAGGGGDHRRLGPGPRSQRRGAGAAGAGGGPRRRARRGRRRPGRPGARRRLGGRGRPGRRAAGHGGPGCRRARGRPPRGAIGGTARRHAAGAMMPGVPLAPPDAPTTRRSRRARRHRTVAVVAVVAALALAGCADGDEAADPPATSAPAASTEPVCTALAALGEAWDVQASGPELGDPEALATLADEQVAAMEAAAADAEATGELPADVAADLALVVDAGTTYLRDAVAWANGDEPDVAPTLPPGTTDAQRRLDAWALDRCRVEVWP